MREIFEDARTCFGLPPADLDTLEGEAARQRLGLRRFIGEVLRDKARELRRRGGRVGSGRAHQVGIDGGAVQLGMNFA